MTINTKSKLCPYYVTGISDGESNFHINIQNNKVNIAFKVTQKYHSVNILHSLQEFFQCGSIQIDNRRDNTLKFQVTKQEDLKTKVFPHFTQYPLLTSKDLDFKSSVKALSMVIEKKHLTKEGMIDIVRLKSNINNKRSWEERYNYCRGKNYTTSLNRDIFYRWLSGFVDGEGSFYFHLLSKTGKFIIRPRLLIGQSSHDVYVLKMIQTILGGGDIKPKVNIENILDVISTTSVIRYSSTDKILPLILDIFTKYSLVTRKSLDFQDFKKLCDIKHKRVYNYAEGILKIQTILGNINSKRKS